MTAEQGRNPSWMPADMTDTECIKEGLSALTDYFNAALDGDESPNGVDGGMFPDGTVGRHIS